MASVIEPAVKLKLPESYEVVNGEIIEVPPMSWYAGEIAGRLNDELVVYGRTARTGRSRVEMAFRIPLREDRSRVRKPDVAFVSFDRWPAGRVMPYYDDPGDVIPDAVVEVVSPNDKAEELLAKVHEYLRVGVRLVWLIYPRVQSIHAFTATETPPRVFTETDILDGGDVLPGFAVPVVNLFPPVTGLPDGPEDEESDEDE